MEIYVACDVCGHRYVLAADREGRNAKCKSCGVSFPVSDDNYYDPETSENDETVEDDDDGDSSSLSPLWDLGNKALHGVAGLATFGILLWMGSLLFRSPQQAAADVAANSSNSNNSRSRSQSSPELNRPSRPNFPQPNDIRPHAPFVPQQPPFVPPQVKPPNRTSKSPPVADGSIGWPTTEPETSPRSPTPTPTPPARTSPRSRNSDLTVGQLVQVEKDGEWIDAIVRRLEGNGTIRVHYRGRSQGDDESVSRERIRTKQ